MSQGLLIGSLTQQRLNTGTHPLAISSLEAASGIALTAPTRFTIADLGNYFLWLTIRAMANWGSCEFVAEVFNVTTATVVDSEFVKAPTGLLPEDYAFYFDFAVTDPSHEYEIRLVLPTAPPPRNNFDVLVPAFKAVIMSTFGGGAGSPEYAGGQLDSGGGGVPIALGDFIQFSVNNSYVIREGRLLGTPPGGTITVDVLTLTFAVYPVFGSITGGSPLTFAVGDKVSDTVLAGWTTAVAAGSIIRMATIAPATVITERCTCELLLQRS